MEIIATLGPSGLDLEWIRKLSASGATIFRLNGTFVDPAVVRGQLIYLSQELGADARFMVDLPGNKIRTRHISRPLPLRVGRRLSLSPTQFSHPVLAERLVDGDEILTNDGRTRLRYLGRAGEFLQFESLSDGVLGNNKGIHVQKAGMYDGLDCFTEKDLALLDALKDLVDFIALSYVREPGHVDQLNAQLAGARAQPMIKVETREAMTCLEGIAEKADILLIDRGDLSSEIGIYEIPAAQRLILQAGHAAGCKVMAATQIAWYMVDNPTPLIAEVDALSALLEQGFDGVQLSDETAVGQHATRVLDFVTTMAAISAPQR